MKILIYGLNFTPELTGIGKYTGEMADWLATRGHEVRVVTTPPYYPSWRVRADYRAGAYSVEDAAKGEVGRLRVYRCPLWVPRKPTGLTRMLHLMSFALSSLPVALWQAVAWRPDAVFTVEPAFFCAPGALLTARLAGAASWLHVQDFELEAAFDLGLLPTGGYLQRFAKGFEEMFTRLFDRVSSISPNMVARLAVKRVPDERKVLFPNWVDVEAVRPLPRGEQNRNRTEWSVGKEKVVLLYSGNMGRKQGLEALAPLARSLASDPRIHFVFCGDGAFRPQLESEVAGLENVTLLPLQPVERLNELLNAADIHLLPQRADAADLVMPSKLTGMLASGRPVVATAAQGTQVAQMVEGLGIAVPSQHVPELREAVLCLVDDSEWRMRLGAAARAYAVEHLGREKVLLRFEEELERVVRARKSVK